MHEKVRCEHCDSEDVVHNTTTTVELHQQQRTEVSKSYSCNDCGRVTIIEE